eukprot:2757856-Rhodomonas_salina.2
MMMRSMRRQQARHRHAQLNTNCMSSKRAGGVLTTCARLASAPATTTCTRARVEASDSDCH